MKKLTSLFFIALLVLVLSGCDLIGIDTIEEVTEELCRDTPDHLLCQEDVLANLEESVVLDLFNEMLNSYNEAEADVDVDADGFCDSYISVTNIDLLDSCRTDISSLFPEGIEDFVILSVTIEDNEYKVELQNKTYADKIMFSIRTGFDNGNIVITKMAYGPIYVLSPPNAKEDVLDLINMFILDMENDLLTNPEVCALWDGIDNDCDGIDNDCDGIDEDCDDFDVARRKFKAGASLSKKVNIIEIDDSNDDDDDDDVLLAEIEFTLDGHVTVLKIAFQVDIFEDELHIFILDPDSDGDTILDMVEGIEKVQIKRILEEFVADFIDTTKTDLEVCEIWYDGTDNDCNKIIEQRIKYLSATDLTTMIDVLDDDDDGDGLFEAEVSFTLDGHVTVVKIAIEIDYSADEMKLVIIESDFEEVFNLDEIEKLWSDFIEDYLDPTILGEDLDLMYFNEMIDSGFLDTRDLNLERGITINTSHIEYTRKVPGPLFTIDFEKTIDGVITNEKVEIRVNRIDMALHISFDNTGGMHLIPRVYSLAVLDNYMMEYNHMSMISSSMCKNTIVDYQVDECSMGRDMMISDGYMMLEYELYILDNQYIVDFIFEDSVGNQILESKTLLFMAIDDGLFLLEFIQ